MKLPLAWLAGQHPLTNALFCQLHAIESAVRHELKTTGGHRAGRGIFSVKAKRTIPGFTFVNQHITKLGKVDSRHMIEPDKFSVSSSRMRTAGCRPARGSISAPVSVERSPVRPCGKSGAVYAVRASHAHSPRNIQSPKPPAVFATSQNSKLTTTPTNAVKAARERHTQWRQVNSGIHATTADQPRRF